jgi:hypothetical protein
MRTLEQLGQQRLAFFDRLAPQERVPGTVPRPAGYSAARFPMTSRSNVSHRHDTPRVRPKPACADAVFRTPSDFPAAAPAGRAPGPEWEVYP